MASHLHWYIDGTVGEQDGTEIDISQALNFTMNTAFKLTGSKTATGGYYPPVILPLYFRMETGYEIAEGEFYIGYREYEISGGAYHDINFIGALGTTYNYDQSTPILFQTQDSLNKALKNTNIGITRIGNNKPLAITASNKITNVNSAIVLIALCQSPELIGSANAQEIVQFSFTETTTA